MTESLKEPKDLRYRTQYFPGAENLLFDTAQKGFVPLPIILRKVLIYLSAAELRVLVYLQLRCSRFGICYPSIDEMVLEIGLTSKKNLMPHILALVEKRFISMHASKGKHFFLVHGPHVPIEHLWRAGKLSSDQLFEINELYKDLGQKPLVFEESLTLGGDEARIPLE